jgi:hypothetical protein
MADLIKAMENLLKLNGIKEFFSADKAYFVQKRIDLNAREVGRELWNPKYIMLKQKPSPSKKLI